MPFSVSNFRSSLNGGGARPTLFEVQISNPVVAASDVAIPFMVKAAQLPTSTLGSIEAPYFGRKIQLAGDRTFEPWTVTVINDENFVIRNALEAWSNAINSHEGNIRQFGTSSPNEYKSQGQVTQFGQAGQILREYNFQGIYPTEIGSIDLSWESTDTIEEFTVTFQYDFWNISGGSTGNSTS